MPELVTGDFTGTVERAWIMATLATLAGGQAFETAVPDSVTLDTETDGALLPYIIARFARPQAIDSGRNIATDEQGQPHQLSVTILVIGGDADAVNATLTAALRLLVGKHPSLTATQLKARGGFAWGQSEAGSRPTRFEEAAFLRCTINS